MANIPLDDLQIDIVVNASKAESAITKLANSLKKLGELKPDTSKIKEFIHELSAMANESVRIDFLTESLNKLQKALAKFQMPKGLASTMQENIKQSVSPEDALMKVPSTKDVSAMAASFKNIADQIKILNDIGKTATGFYMIVDEVERLAATAPKLNTVASSISKVSKVVANSSASSRSGNTSETDTLGRGSREGRIDTENAGSAIQDTGNKTEDAGNKAKAATGKFGGLLASFKRIAMYRALRSAIRAITSAFQEGVQNLVQWDSAFANTSGALATMTEIKSLATQIKNTLGAMAMPIIQTFLPVLRLVAQGLMFIANIINQVVRAFQGHATYIKAVYKEVDYLGDSLGNAGAKAKELQRILFGFDDLNVLPSENKGGGTGGTGVLNGLNDMFDEVDVSPFLKGIMDDINYWLGPLFTKEFWGQIWTDITYWFDPLFNGETWKGIYDDIVYWFGQAYSWLDEHIFSPISKLFEKVHTEEIEPKVRADDSPIRNLADTARGTKGEISKMTIKPEVAADDTPIRKLPEKVSKAQTDIKKIPLKLDTTVVPVSTKTINTVKDDAQNAVKKLPGLAFGTVYSAPTNGSTTRKNAQTAIAKLGSISLESKLASITNQSTVKTNAQNSVDKLSAVGYKSTLYDPSNKSTVRTDAQTYVNKLSPIGYASKVTDPSNKSTVRTDAQNAVNKLSPVTYKSAVNSILGSSSDSSTTSLWGNWNFAKKWLSTGALSFPAKVASFTGQKSDSGTNTLWGAWNSAVKWLSTGSLVFSSILGYNGLGDSLEWVWTELQKALNRNPLEFTSQITSAPTNGNNAFSGKALMFSNRAASGGVFPNVGSLILAGEAGAEIVADLGSHTGVMNVNQMQEAVAAGNTDVINAIFTMANMVVNAVNGKDLNVYMDGAKIGQNVTNYQNNQMRRGIAY